jgi:hypothetical protein
MGIGRGAGTLWQWWVYRGCSTNLKRCDCNWRRREGHYMWKKRDRSWNWISRRRYGWIINITRVPVRPHYVGLSLVEAESGSLFDT